VATTSPAANLNRPDLTAQKFVNHPLHGRIYRTGDLVQLLPSGELMYCGRIDMPR
jgi:non-ribosomal peptide synthetase component F